MTEESRGEDSSRKIGVVMVVAMWLVVLGLLTAFFTQWQEKQLNPNRTLHISDNENGVREVVLQRNRYGHYVATGAINDIPVVFMLDTGATDISVPQGIADQLGLEPGPAVYYETANGDAKAFMTRLGRVSLGAISLQGVRAHINPNYHADEVLLGMTFLKHLEFTQQGDKLTLRQYP